MLELVKAELMRAASAPLIAANSGSGGGQGRAAGGAESIKPDGTSTDLTGTIKQIISVAIFAVGIISVVVIIIGGVNYAMSQGDPGKVKKGKDTIMYGIIGLVVAILAFAIVNFALGAVGGSTNGVN